MYLVTYFGLHGINVLNNYLAAGKILSCREDNDTITVRFYHKFPNLEEPFMNTDLVFSESNGYLLVQAIERWSNGDLFQELNCEYEAVDDIQVPKQFVFTRYRYDKDENPVRHFHVEAQFSDWKLGLEDQEQFTLEGLSRMYPDVRIAYDFSTTPPVEIHLKDEDIE